ncbi:putative flavin-containing monooxygenase 1 [Apium graveolens]|uniref:putative flavin-containing monooxygenase 1 n=1 Tax=Apium graveolens TaxID=4045 RepID=UPI003D7B73BF
MYASISSISPILISLSPHIFSIGVGISGIAACKYSKSKGFIPIVFESETSVGGVWRKTISTTRLPNPKQHYQFSDFPWPPSVKEEFSSQVQVFQYLESHANHFDLLQHIRFGCLVVSIRYDGPSDEKIRAWSLWGGKGDPNFNTKGKCHVIVKDQKALSTEVYQVSFVILCFGKFSSLPNNPECPKGTEHPCTVVYRTEHWGIPSFLPMGISIPFPYGNRFSELMVHKPGESFALSLLESTLTPLVRIDYQVSFVNLCSPFPIK